MGVIGWAAMTSSWLLGTETRPLVVQEGGGRLLAQELLDQMIVRGWCEWPCKFEGDGKCERPNRFNDLCQTRPRMIGMLRLTRFFGKVVPPVKRAKAPLAAGESSSSQSW